MTFVITQFAMGITVLIARYIGEKDEKQIGPLIGGATVFAQAVSVVFALVLLLKKQLPFTIKKQDFRINANCRWAMKVGLPLALQECLTQGSFLALCAFVNRLGLTASSGYGVACKLVNFAMLIPSALMQSMASFVSQNVGAGNEKRAKKSMFTGIEIGLGIGLAAPVATVFGIVLNVVYYIRNYGLKKR